MTIAEKPKPVLVELNLKKLNGLCCATDEILGDASVLEEIIKDGFKDEFSFKLDDAVINGIGAG